jgi:subtilase family serine protease
VSRLRSRRRGRALCAATALAAGALLAGAASATAAAPVAHRITVTPAMTPTPQVAQHATRPDAVTFGCQTNPLDGSQGPRCYQPAQIQNAYGLTPLLNAGTNGTGRTIVIIDAFSSPTIVNDLKIFDSTFTEISPAGAPPTFDPNNGNQVGWGIETTLDVEWAHAAAPGANIVLAHAKSNDDADILATTKYVIEHNVGDVISQSFGEAEACMDPALLAEQHTLFAEATREGITLFASSGDRGASQFNCAGTAAIKAASTPASDPYVTGVGGTTLDANTSTGAYIGETAWTEPFGCNPPAVALDDVNCSGGGFSSLFPRPGFQAASIKGPMTTRGVPDVAYNAGVASGVLIHCGFCNVIFAGLPPDAPVFFIIGGTSAGSPQWAGLTAVGEQLGGHRFGTINPALYAISHSKKQYAAAMHDITTGNNDVSEIGGGFDAGPGWDAVTGLGTPNAVNLLPLLAKRTG